MGTSNYQHGHAIVVLNTYACETHHRNPQGDAETWVKLTENQPNNNYKVIANLSKRFVPIASISSIKMMQGDFSLASWKASRTSFAPSPMNI